MDKKIYASPGFYVKNREYDGTRRFEVSDHVYDDWPKGKPMGFGLGEFGKVRYGGKRGAVAQE